MNILMPWMLLAIAALVIAVYGKYGWRKSRYGKWTRRTGMSVQAWPNGWRFSLIFAWFDCWIGWYYDRQKRRLYVFPVPMIGVVIQL